MARGTEEKRRKNRGEPHKNRRFFQGELESLLYELLALNVELKGGAREIELPARGS